MDSVGKNKQKFILAWYKIEKRKLSLNQQLMLLKRWSDSCMESEEYEMVNVLKLERIKVIRQIRLKKKGVRSILNYLRLYLRILLRRIKRKF